MRHLQPFVVVKTKWRDTRYSCHAVNSLGDNHRLRDDGDRSVILANSRENQRLADSREVRSRCRRPIFAHIEANGFGRDRHVRIPRPWHMHREHGQRCATRKQRHPAVVVERDKTGPQIGRRLRQLRRPSIMPLREHDRGLCIDNTIGMRTEAGADRADVEAGRLGMVESPRHHRMDQRKLWRFPQRDAKAERAVRRQIADERVRQSIITAISERVMFSSREISVGSLAASSAQRIGSVFLICLRFTRSNCASRRPSPMVTR